MARYQENPHRKKMWFGTQHHSEWIDCPLRNADMSPEGWGTEGTYLSGGGFVRQSPDSHRNYIFEWSGASSIEAAEKMQMYRDGVYSHRRSDLIYFHDPLIYTRNILPKRWAQPSIQSQVGVNGSITHITTPTDMMGQGVPLLGASVKSKFTSASAITGPQSGVLWISIPPGKTLRLTAWIESDSGANNGLYYRSVTYAGTLGIVTKITGSARNNISSTNARGVMLYVVGNPTIFGIRAILTEGNQDIPGDWGADRRWRPGLGHSGCRFVGNPTWAATSGVNGGQIGYAATLKEVGDWL